MAEEAGFEIEHAEERPEDIKTHYAKLVEQLEDPPTGLDKNAVDALQASLSHWQRALTNGHITWACIIARKPKQG